MEAGGRWVVDAGGRWAVDAGGRRAGGGGQVVGARKVAQQLVAEEQ